MRVEGVLILEDLGAPEEIRTPNPQIRSLFRQFPKSLCPHRIFPPDGRNPGISGEGHRN